MTDSLTDAWNATAAALPTGWQLDGIRCTSTGLGLEERGDEWRAIAVRSDGARAEATAPDPVEALNELLRTLPA